ncbi:MAG TPA: hypothetical protein HA362_08160 [Nanoarchaeota archaeon]|nr:hypothetical protein [Nanoarchaeota archaeon]
MEKKSTVLISGGIDSCVALYWAIKEGLGPSCLTFTYPEQPQPEKEAIDRICAATNTPRYSIEHPLVLGADIKPLIPDNLFYYATAIAFARNNGIDYVIGGQNKDDWIESNDAPPMFYNQMNNLLNTSYGQDIIQILQPLLYLSKLDVVKLGLSLGAPLEHTWSCQGAGPNPCGICSSCITRTEIAKQMGINL